MTKVHPQIVLRILLCSTVCFALLVFLLQARLPELSQQEVELPVRQGMIKGTLWLPGSSVTPKPGVLLVHGVASSRRSVQSLAKTLAYQGFGVFIPDLRGYGESLARGESLLRAEDYTEDVEDSLAFLRGHPAINGREVAVLGHSLGASAVAGLSSQPLPSLQHMPRLRIGLSMHGDGTAASSLQWWTGLYDPFHPPYVSEFQYVSPCASHGLALEDICVKKKLLTTLSTTFHQPFKTTDFWLSVGLQAGMVGLGISLVGLWVWGPLAVGGYSLLLASVSACVIFSLAGYFRWLYPPYCATAIALLTFGYVLRLAYRSHPLLKVFKWSVVVYLSYVSASVLRGLVALSVTALPLSDLRYLPLFVMQSIGYVPQWLHDKMLALFFQQQYARLEPALVFWLFWGIEILWPGRLVKSLAQAVQLWEDQVFQKSSYPIGLLLLLLGALGGILYWRVGQGYISIKIMQNLMQLGVGSVLPTVLFFWLYHRVLLKKCPRDDSNIRPTV